MKSKGMEREVSVLKLLASKPANLSSVPRGGREPALRIWTLTSIYTPWYTCTNPMHTIKKQHKKVSNAGGRK